MTLSHCSRGGNDGSSDKSSISGPESADDAIPNGAQNSARRRSATETESDTSSVSGDRNDGIEKSDTFGSVTAAESDKEGEQSDTESEIDTNTLVDDDSGQRGWLQDTPTSGTRSSSATSDGRTEGRGGGMNDGRRAGCVGGIRDLGESTKKAHWSKCPSPDVFKIKRCTSSLAERPTLSGTATGGVTNLRPKSSLGHRATPLATSAEKRANISSFQRSLRLLGFQPEDFGMRQGDAGEQERKSRSRARTSVASTLQTRLVKRSVSLDCLRDAVKKENSPDTLETLDREALSKAVYEEWYFKKLQETRTQKKLLLAHEQKKQEDQDSARAEKLQKIEDSLSKWKAIKAQEKKKKMKGPGGKATTTSLLQKYDEPAVSKEAADKAFERWKKEKEKLLKEEKKVKNEAIRKKIEKEKAAAQEKKADAQKVFNDWKKKADEALKKCALERRKKMKEEANAKETRKHAFRNEGIPFEQWKILKDSEMKAQLRKQSLAAAEKERSQSARRDDRRYEAEQVFEEWLDEVEERERRRHRMENKRRGSLPPPWSPL